MAVRPVIKLTRKQIYDEVWSVAVSGMALKYSIPYSSLLKQIKDADVPIPTSGYWTKREFNKETTVTPLSGNPDEIITLYASSATASRERKNNTAQTKEPESQMKVSVPEKKEEVTEKIPQPKENPLTTLGEPEVEESKSRGFNGCGGLYCKRIIASCDKNLGYTCESSNPTGN